jgi:hypothetical protein
MPKTDMEKLEILLKHWVEHNEEHAGEFEEWAEKAEASGHSDASDNILSAVKSMRQANEHLLKAMRKLS